MTLELRCPKHPTYRAIHTPRVDCKDCVKLYKSKNKTDRSAMRHLKTR